MRRYEGVDNDGALEPPADCQIVDLKNPIYMVFIFDLNYSDFFAAWTRIVNVPSLCPANESPIAPGSNSDYAFSYSGVIQ